MANFTIPEAFTIKGNSPTENAVLSVLEAQVRAELTSEASTIFMRMDATDEQIVNMAGVAMAIYRVTVRVLWGSTWSDSTGTTAQVGDVFVTKLDIDQRLAIDFNIPEFDIERFLKSPADVGVAIVANWTASFTRNLYENLELIFLQGATDYFIAKSLVLPLNLINLTPEEAVDAYYTIGKRNNKLVKKIDQITVGINRSDLIGAVGIDSSWNLSKAFVRLNFGQIAADTIVTGKRYKQDIMGMEFWESFYMEQTFTHNTATAMHLEKDYLLARLFGMVNHRRMWGMPISFTRIRSKLDNNTDNVKIIGKCLYALPAAIRPDIGYAIMDKMPTVAEMTAARSKDKLTNPTGTDLTYQSCRYDNLTLLDINNIIFFINLGKITIADAGGVPTAAELNTAIVNAGNLGYESAKATISGMTAATDTEYGTATVTGNGTDYFGTVQIQYLKA